MQETVESRYRRSEEERMVESRNSPIFGRRSGFVEIVRITAERLPVTKHDRNHRSSFFCLVEASGF